MLNYPTLFIDKLAITLPLEGQRAQEVHEAVIESHHDHWADYITPGRVAIRGYRGNYEFVTPKGIKASLFLQSTNPRNNNFRLEYSPNNFGESGRALLGAYLHEILGRRYLNDIRTAKLTRLDIAFDVPRVHLKDLLINDLRRRKSLIIRGKDGVVETYYFPFDSTNQLCVYDKTQEINDRRRRSSNRRHIQAHRVRFEYRYSKMKGYTIANVYDRMRNPFNQFDVRQFSRTQARLTNEHARVFFDACRMAGVDSILNEMSDPATRDGLLAIYRTFPVPTFWLRRTSIWITLREAIENALPR